MGVDPVADDETLEQRPVKIARSGSPRTVGEDFLE
jgi:hypothetical protein